MHLEAEHRSTLLSLIARDDVRLRLLGHVASLNLPDCWIGAGFVRSAVWDHLHGRSPEASWDDIDVVWFDKNGAAVAADEAIEAHLKQADPSANWSVKNQARMHLSNGDAPYLSVEDAISRWPETATAVALRLQADAIDILAPLGLDDLFSMVIRPTPSFTGHKLSLFHDRMRAKQWLDRWPRLTVAGACLT